MTGVIYKGLSNITHNPIVGETRYDASNDSMKIWNGKSWDKLKGYETIHESVQELLDRIIYNIEEDYPNNIAIKDALKEWKAACEKFQVVLALSENTK